MRFSRIRHFLLLPGRDRLLTGEAAVMLCAASLVLLVVHFRFIARWLGATGEITTPEADPLVLKAIGRAVDRAARHLPWHPVCLPQAMAAQAMLRRRGIHSTVLFGVKLEGGERKMAAHAWLMAGTIGVVGLGAAQGFTVVARFSR